MVNDITGGTVNSLINNKEVDRKKLEMYNHFKGRSIRYNMNIHAILHICCSRGLLVGGLKS